MLPERRLPPGPRGFKDILDLIRERRKSPLTLYLRLVREYGDLVYFEVGRIGYALVSDPAAIGWVMQDNRDNYPKGPGYDRLRPLLGNGLLISDGELWKKQRRLAAPAFQQDRIRAACHDVVRSTRQMFDRWDVCPTRTARLDLATEMNRLALHVAGQVLLGSDTDSRAEEVREALRDVLRFQDGGGLVWLRVLDMLTPGADRNLAFWIERFLPTPANRRFKRSLATLNGIVAQIIENRRRRPVTGDDLLSAFMRARDETGACMSDAQLRDEVMTMLMAGHETTATAMTWMWHVLWHNPEIAGRVREEVDRVLGNRTPVIEDIVGLELAHRVFEEVLRCYPPFWRLTRQARTDDWIMGWYIPRGTVMIISPYVAHHNPRYWSDPETFNPLRFTEAASRQRPKFTYIPFGAGPRVCVASSFAFMEALTVIAMTMQRYRIRLLDSRPAELEAGITLRPRNGLVAEVSSR